MAICLNCQKTFSCVSTLNRHKRNVHGEMNKKFEKSKLGCPSNECFQQFDNYQGLREHLETSHGGNNSYEEFVFESEEDFEHWRYQIQNETSSEYVKGSSTKVKADGCKKTYLYCNRSYKYRPKRKGDGLRAIKFMGSRKIGKVCPSTMEVTKKCSENGVLLIKVKFWKDHFGHTCDLRHITVPERDRDEIARKLKSGMTLDGVLSAIRRTDGNMSKRTCLIGRNDLHNIVQQYNISYPTNSHKDDGLSEEIWVNEIEQMEDNLILFPKDQGQKLICSSKTRPECIVSSQDENTLCVVGNFVTVH